MLKVLGCRWRGVPCTWIRGPLHVLGGRGRIVGWLRGGRLVVGKLQCSGTSAQAPDGASIVYNEQILQVHRTSNIVHTYVASQPAERLRRQHRAYVSAYCLLRDGTPMASLSVPTELLKAVDGLGNGKTMYTNRRMSMKYRTL